MADKEGDLMSLSEQFVKPTSMRGAAGLVAAMVAIQRAFVMTIRYLTKHHIYRSTSSPKIKNFVEMSGQF